MLGDLINVNKSCEFFKINRDFLSWEVSSDIVVIRI